MSTQTVSIEDLEKFTTSNQREILFYLHQLINDGDRISVVFNEGNDTILTLLLDVDEERSLLTFDWGGSEETNQRLLKSARNFFVCAPHGVRNQFLAGAVRQTSFNNKPAFVTGLPDRYTRLQRREFFRLVLPISLRPTCSIPLPSGSVLRLPIVDISIGGIAMEFPAGRPPFEIGQLLPTAHIEMKGGTVIDVDLEVRNLGEVQRGKKVAGRMGCRFIKLSRSVENQLQRFIIDVQREEHARLGS